MEILTSVRRLYISFKSLVNDFVYSFGRAALLLLVEVQNHTVPVRERRRIRDDNNNKYEGKGHPMIDLRWVRALTVPIHLGLINGPFVPQNLISAQKSPVPLPRFQMAPRFKILMSSGSKKGTHI